MAQNTALNTAQPEYWQIPANWSLGHVPAKNEPVVVPPGVVIQTQAGDALGGTLGNDAGGTSRTAPTTIAGQVTLNQTSNETDFSGILTISAGGVLLVNDPTNVALIDCLGIVCNSSLLLSGTLGLQFGGALGDIGVLTINGYLTIFNGATIINCTPQQIVVTLSWFTNPVYAPCTWNVIQYADVPPSVFTLVSVQGWTDVAVNARLGAIGVLTTDCGGNLLDPISPPTAFVYRNGSLWHGVIQITRKNTGNYSIDLDFADGIWALGDHGEVHIFWCQLGSDGATPQWFGQIYYWLVNRLNYETWERVTKALPDNPPDEPGGLPILDANGLLPDSVSAAQFPTAVLSALITAGLAEWIDAEHTILRWTQIALELCPTTIGTISQVGTQPITPGKMQVYQFAAFVFPGSGAKQTIAVIDQNGDPINLAGRTIELIATSPADSSTALWKWTTAAGGGLTIVGAGSNVIQINADSTNSHTAGDFELFAWDITNGAHNAIPEAHCRLSIKPAPQP